MDKMLEKLMNGLSPSEAEGFADSFGAFGGAEVSPDEQSRILSSVMRKAGAEMKENNTVKKKRKYSKRFFGFAAAAVLFAVGTIGMVTYAYTQFFHRQEVERFFGEQTTDYLESRGLAINEVRENEHVRMTLDAVLSDGYNAYMLFTLEKLDYMARATSTPDYRYIDMETGKEINLHGAGLSLRYEESDSDDGYYSHETYFREHENYSFRLEFPAHGEIDLTGPLKVVFKDNYDQEYKGIFDGIEFEVDMSRNIDCAILRSDEGIELLFSSIGIFGDRLPYSKYGIYERGSIVMLKADGTRERLEGPEYLLSYVGRYGDPDYAGGEERFSLFFDELCNFDDYIGAEIEGVPYLKTITYKAN